MASAPSLRPARPASLLACRAATRAGGPPNPFTRPTPSSGPSATHPLQPTMSGWLPDPFMRIFMKNMHKTKHGSDSG